LKRLDKFYRALFRAGKDQGIIRKDIDINFLLLLYTKLTELLIEPDSLDNFSYSNKMAYKMISKTFLEGAMADGRKRCKE
jgi:hypothetical protein